MDNSSNTMHPLLKLATIAGVETSVKHHIRRGDDLNARDAKGATPLMLAAKRKKIGVVRLLLAANANPALLDPDGNDALTYAQRAGCLECAALVRDALAIFQSQQTTFDTVVYSPEDDTPTIPALNIRTPGYNSEEPPILDKKDNQTLSQIKKAPTPFLQNTNPAIHATEPLSEVKLRNTPTLTPLQNHAPLKKDSTTTEPEFDETSHEFELNDWEPEPEQLAPQGNNTIETAVLTLNKLIRQHKAIDINERWDDVDLFLPETAQPLPQNKNEAGHIYNLLLRAYREGRIPESSVIEVCLKPDETRNEEAEQILIYVLGDLGAVIDADPDFEVCSYDRAASVDEDLELSEALLFAEDLASGRNEPMRLYTKSLKDKLLGAQEELDLARQMEECSIEAMDTLSRWPVGLEIIFEAADKVARQEADVESFSSGAEIDEEEVSAISNDLLEDIDEQDVELDPRAAAFVSAVSQIKSLQIGSALIIQALEAANLSQGFLRELSASAGDDPTGVMFASAISRKANARNKMICSNLRLAYSTAIKYQWANESLSDLIQEANIGLIKAVEKYDWRKGFRFSTYAIWWIRQQITRSITDKSRSIRIPAHMHELISRIRRERDKFMAQAGRSDSEHEISQRTNISLNKIWRVLSLLEDIESLDKIDSNSGVPVVELQIDPTAVDPATSAEIDSLQHILNTMVCELEPRLAKIISLRFGLENDESMTLEEIGLIFDVTRERIRQIEMKALKKLSIQRKKEILAPFIGDQYTLTTANPDSET